MREFLGIPYAAAPVGDLRWRPPQEHERWKGVRDATHFANHCPQGPSPYGIASLTEDCLYLNVFTPPKTNQGRPHLLPVMVWIHGGGLIVGESDGYDPSPLVAQGIVVVTINYRIGMLGFLAHPALDAESSYGGSGNYGFMDQQAALGWVQRNIRAFGGDPDNVTIFGESAGGYSVQAQLVSPLAAGLFHKTIVESGAYSLTQSTLASAETFWKTYTDAALAATPNCTDQTTAACLRALTVVQIVTAQPPSTIFANLDNFVLPRSMGEAFQSGQFNQVPVIEGSNHDEWRLFVAQAEKAPGGHPLTLAEYPFAIAGLLGIPFPPDPAFANAQALANFVYPVGAYGGSPSIAFGALGTDAVFSCNARKAATYLSAHVPTFQYEFADENAPMLFFAQPISFSTGAYHASEIQYLFTLSETPVPFPGFTVDQQKLSDAMVGYWTQFARTGDPGWPQFSGPPQQFQSLVPPTPATSTGFAASHKCSIWTPGI